MTLSWTGPGGVLYEMAPVGVIILTSEAASEIWGAFKFNLGRAPGYERVEVKKLHQIKVYLCFWFGLALISSQRYLQLLPYLQSLWQTYNGPGL